MTIEEQIETYYRTGFNDALSLVLSSLETYKKLTKKDTINISEYEKIISGIFKE